jgi:D-alanyl-D-alanine carboxypeptidase
MALNEPVGESLIPPHREGSDLSLDKLTALAGYLAIDSQRPLGFAILVNDIPAGQRASARALADDIVDALVAFLGTS